MSEIKISKRYANALYEFAAEQNMADRIFDDMSLVYNSAKGSKELRNFLRSPVIKVKKKFQVLKAVFGDAVSDVTIHFVEIITKARRERFLHLIAEQYIRIYKESKGIKTAVVKTAVELSDKIKKEIIEMLEKQTGSKIELDEEVKADLIGGFVITLDNKEIDTSIKSKLNRMRKGFEKNLYQGKY